MINAEYTAWVKGDPATNKLGDVSGVECRGVCMNLGQFCWFRLSNKFFLHCS